MEDQINVLVFLESEDGFLGKSDSSQYVDLDGLLPVILGYAQEWLPYSERCIIQSNLNRFVGPAFLDPFESGMDG